MESKRELSLDKINSVKRRLDEEGIGLETRGSNTMRIKVDNLKSPFTESVQQLNIIGFTFQDVYKESKRELREFFKNYVHDGVGGRYPSYFDLTFSDDDELERYCGVLLQRNEKYKQELYSNKSDESIKSDPVKSAPINKSEPVKKDRDYSPPKISPPQYPALESVGVAWDDKNNRLTIKGTTGVDIKKMEAMVNRACHGFIDPQIIAVKLITTTSGSLQCDLKFIKPVFAQHFLKNLEGEMKKDETLLSSIEKKEEKLSVDNTQFYKAKMTSIQDKPSELKGLGITPEITQNAISLTVDKSISSSKMQSVINKVLRDFNGSTNCASTVTDKGDKQEFNLKLDKPSMTQHFLKALHQEIQRNSSLVEALDTAVNKMSRGGMRMG